VTVSSALEHLQENWKTTLAGFLNTVVALTAAGLFAPNPFINTKLSGYLLAFSGMANIVLHVIMADGTQTTVNLPASAAPMQMTVPAGSTATVKTPEKP
jgi:hypothetical protein